MKGLPQKVQQYLVKGPSLERLRGVVEHEIFGHFGMGRFEVINNIHTPEGFQKRMSTTLWDGGTGMARRVRILADLKAMRVKKAWSSGPCT